MMTPDIFWNGPFQAKRDNEIRLEQRHRFRRHGIIDIKFYRDFVATLSQLHVQPLTETVERMGQKQNTHNQQMRGNCSPLNQSTIRLPPNSVVISTNWCGSSRTSPMMAASWPKG